MPKLLHAGRVILSERAHAKDEAEFAGAVAFLDNMSAIADAYTRLARSEGLWRKRARQATHVFRARFTPTAIFERAGIYRDLALRWRGAAGSSTFEG